MHKPGQLLTAFMDATKKTRGEPFINAKKVRATITLAARRGVKFIGPQRARIDDDKPLSLEDLRPPYPVTVIEGHVFNSNGVAAAIIARDTGDHVELNFVAHPDEETRELIPTLGEWLISPFTCRVQYSDTSAHEPFELEMKAFSVGHTWTSHDLATDDSYQPFLHYYFAVCQILANHHVETRDVLPDAKESRSRKIRGKAPLFTYKTLTIGAPKDRRTGRGGGTHASPRSHLRRGYYRTSKNGVRHWVQACMVKGETPGFVHKDYLVCADASSPN